MINSDFVKFCTVWTATASLYRNEPVSDMTLRMAFEILKEYSVEEVGDALLEASKTSLFAPTPALVNKIITERKGIITDPKLNAKVATSRFFKDLDANLSISYDYVCPDARAVQAFKAVFRSIYRYCISDEFTTQQGIRSFEALYPTMPITGNVLEDCLIKGTNHQGINFSTSVRCLIGFKECQPLLRDIYGDRKVNLVLLKTDPAYIPKALPKPQIGNDFIPKEQFIGLLNGLINQLKGV